MDCYCIYTIIHVLVLWQNQCLHGKGGSSICDVRSSLFCELQLIHLSCAHIIDSDVSI